MTYGKKDESDEDLIETFKGWFRQVAEVEAKQRKNENEDLQMQVAECQWDEKARMERMGQDGRPGRPTLSISLTKHPMQLVKNQAAAVDLGVEIHPVSEKAEKDTAEALQGLYRRIERDSNAPLARLHAFDRAVQCGRGWYQVVTQYDEDGDDEFDQEVAIKRILDGAMVGIDPSAQEPDYSDAQWGYLDEWMALDVYKDAYPDSEVASLADEDFADLASNEPLWVKGGGGEKRAVRTPQVWRKKHKRTTVCVVRGPGGKPIMVQESEVGRRKVLNRKTRDDITLCWYRITAREILDREEYEGLRLIPLIPVVWNELQPFDSERRYEGMQRPARDGQRAFNFAISAAVEDVGRLSKVPYLGPAGAFRGFEEKWDTINLLNWSYVEYNVIGVDGKPISKPEPMQVDGTKLGLSLQLAEMAKGLVQSATAVYDPSLGKDEGRRESGKKVLALQQQADAGTSNGLENLTSLTLNYEARVVKERIPYVYDRAGRVTRILGEEDKVKLVMLNAPYVLGQDGRPQRVTGKDMTGAKIIDFTRGKYSTAVSVGRSYQTRLQQGQEVWAQLMPKLPPEAQVILLPTVMRFMDTPGATDAAELLGKFRDAKFPGLVDKEGAEPTPEQLKAQLAGQQQKMAEMGQQLQAAIQKLETDFAKQQADVYKAQLEFQKAIKLQEVRNAGAVAVAEVNARAKGVASENETAVDLLAMGVEAERASVDRDHERRMQHETLAHDVAMAHAGGTTVTQTKEGGQETGSEKSQERGSSSAPAGSTE